MLTLIIVCFWLGVTVLVASAVAIGVDNSRLARADRAGREAAEAWRERNANPPPPYGLDVHLTDWGEEHENRRWHWTIWRSDARDPAVADLVEGVIVPAGMGNAPTPEDAERAAFAAIAEWQKSNGWNGPIRVLNQADL